MSLTAATCTPPSPPTATDPPQRAWWTRARTGWPRRLRHWGATLARAPRHPLTILLGGCLAAFLVGLFVHPHGFVLLAGLVAVLIVGTVVPWLTVTGLTGQLTFPAGRAREGEPLRLRATLTNRWPWPLVGLAVRGHLSREPALGLAGDGSRPSWPNAATLEDTPLLGISLMPPRSQASFEWTWTPPLRGRYPHVPPRIETGFPFGLLRAQRALTLASPLTVWPAAYPTVALPAVEGDASRHTPNLSDRIGHSGDLVGVRPYQRGDPLRRVHWGQTARHDRLIVCELQAAVRHPEVQIVLDPRPDAASDNPDNPNASHEWAIRAAASLLASWVPAGANVSVIMGSRCVPAAGGRRHLEGLLDALAVLPHHGHPGLTELLDSPPVRRFTNGLQVVIATDTALAEVVALGRTQPPWRRLVVLKVAGFRAASGRPASGVERLAGTPPRAWMVLDTPDRAAAALTRWAPQGFVWHLADTAPPTPAQQLSAQQT